MADRPAFGTAPIRCGRTRCKWRGYETGMKEVPEIMGGWRCTKRICPACGCDSYSFMTPGEIKAWERAQRVAPIPDFDQPDNQAAHGITAAQKGGKHGTD